MYVGYQRIFTSRDLLLFRPTGTRNSKLTIYNSDLGLLDGNINLHKV